MMDSAQTNVTFEASPGIMYKLGSIEAQLKAINDKLDAKERIQDADIELLKTDVAALKHKDAMRLGAAAAISLGIGALFTLIQVIPWQNLS